jgi:hypothetical protein
MKEFITFDSKKPLARNVLHHLRAFLYLLSGHSRRHHPANALPRCMGRPLFLYSECRELGSKSFG